MNDLDEPGPASTFDALAPAYDEVFSNTSLGTMLRAEVRRHIVPLLKDVRRVADIGCGTGIDAAWLGAMGKQVIAIDPSARMVEEAKHRIERQGLSGSVDVRRQDLATFNRTNVELMDFILSNFGALNCIEDVTGQVKRLSKHQPVGGRAAFVLMNRTCLWEQAWFLLSGRPRSAFRRFWPAAFEADGQRMSVYYPALDEFTHAIAPEYRLEASYGIGMLLPPSYLSSTVARHPRVYRWLARQEPKLASRKPFRGLGDHILVVLRRAL